ncbi:hypothetical protein BS50DRAFT_576874 [Corynespora cassiicola Philippines]|uniref:DUF7892 domain-containing protein n=1 Tax=Corynespora cassiicola Philippines TaxID=1448308 RepID=A0A2T2NCE6_CORCC|nr:hypothetical protein BS50DRAFT_576874 [Corynespora cassiicola Philippines]
MDGDRESSVASSTDFYGSDGKPTSPARGPPLDPSPSKRKADTLDHPIHGKKRRVTSPFTAASQLQPCAGLPPAVWQHIFLSCHLADLGRLLQVNRSFHSYLTDVPCVSTPKPADGCLRLLKSESIWASARNALSVKPPKPLPGFSELRMWQLAWSKKCQFCGKKDLFTPGEKFWQHGPAETGVRCIWPFGIRSCGPCLMKRCQTDTSLLFSSANALRPALPFAFIANDQNYIPAYMLQAGTIPAGVEVAKYYYKPHVEEITKELQDVLARGSAAAEEWSKGLDVRGNAQTKVAENWERWEVKYQWWLDHHGPKRSASAAPSSGENVHQLQQNSPSHQAPSPIIHAPVPATSTPQFVQPRPPTIPPQVYTPQPVPGGTQPSRGERNLHDANEAKATRKADIERRCQQMDPPIQPNVLRHMDSFKAAIQISQPMNDYAWSVLQPRLLAQLPAAQQAEADHVSRVASLSTRTTDRRTQDVNSKEAKEVMDREWEESQRPIRDKLSTLADDFINQDWDHGRAVTYENSPKFAVDLLMYVRRMFYSEAIRDEEASAAMHDGQLDAAGPHKPRLVLENMKWVYDNKLKPLTEQFRKELFLCYGSTCENNTRFYGFEGVIQHYGAKHTSSFSVGNVVVAWREAEWPEETPFHPDPISVKNAYHATPGMAAHSAYGAYYGGYSRAGTSTPHVQPHLPQASPGPYHYGGHYNGPFAPPHAAPNPATGYDNYGHSYGAPTDPYSYPPMGPPGYGPQANNNGYAPSPAVTNPAVAPPPVVPPPTQGTDNVRSGSEDVDHRTTLFDKQVSTIIEMAQDIWKQTSGIKDLPNSLRVYVLLQRVISKFHVEFNHEPDLNHFIDALSNHQIPRALKNAPGLSCKACQDESSHQSAMAYYSRPEVRTTYTVLNLFSHFKSQHCGPQLPGLGGPPATTPLDWKEDMIELPSDRFISGLIHAPGMDDDKLHMIATVFPRLFPTPLPRIGVVDNNGVPSPAHSASKDTKDVPRTGGTPGVSTEKSGPSSLASPYAESPRPPKPSEDEYDPQRPALPLQGNPTTRPITRNRSYRGSPPTDRRPRYYAEPRYYMPRDHLEDDYPGPHEYVEFAPSSRRPRDAGPAYDEYHGRRPLYREHETFYGPGPEEVVYAHPRDGPHVQEYEAYPRQVRYYEEHDRRPEYRYVREHRSRDASPALGRSAADRFLDEFVPGQPSTTETSEPEAAPRPAPKPPVAETEVEDGSRYTPPPPSAPAADEPIEPHRSFGPVPRPAPSTVSNGSRYEEHRSGGRQIPTPDSAGGPRRPGPHRRRDRYHDHHHHHHVPSRYYRYMSVARDDPYTRGASIGRSQSRRYERYEEQRRRIDQQETPQPNPEREYDPTYSRDQSVDQGPPDEHYLQPARPAPREYIPIQDRLPYSPPRYRYAGHPEEPRGPPPVYVDEYGYEIIRLPRDHRQPRGPYISHPPSARYMEHDADHIQYVPVSYDRPQRYDGRSNEYVYYEEREPLPPSARRPTFEPPGSEPPPPPPEIKVESSVVPEVP